MGRNRKKSGAGAVERVVYDIFGNVVAQEEPTVAAPVPEPVPQVSEPSFMEQATDDIAQSIISTIQEVLAREGYQAGDEYRAVLKMMRHANPSQL